MTLLQNCGFCFFNPFFKPIGIFYTFLYKTFSYVITDCIFKRKSSVLFFRDSSVHILNRRSGSASLLNELRLFSIIDFNSFTTKLPLFMFEAFRLSVTSSFFFRIKSWFRYDHVDRILNRSNNSQISIETSTLQQAGDFIIKHYLGISNIAACR